jgi:hypothetical protein
MCESSMNPQAISPTGKYMGLFQFSQASWEFVGQQGKPHEASWQTQYKAARDLHNNTRLESLAYLLKKTGVDMTFMDLLNTSNNSWAHAILMALGLTFLVMWGDCMVICQKKAFKTDAQKS